MMQQEKQTEPGFLFHATEEDAGARLDVFLQKKNIFPSREKIIKHVEEGRVTVNGNIVKPSKKIKTGEIIEGEIPEPEDNETVVPEKGELTILYEDGEILVLDKPEGVAVHPGKGRKTGTVVNFLLHHTAELSQKHTVRPGIVHRLDKDTSGVLLIAKNDFAHVTLQEQFKARTVKKIYMAWVHGTPGKKEGEIDAYIAHHPANPKKMTAVKKQRTISGIAAKGPLREAVTHYKVIKEEKQFSLVEVHPVTGRTHQIRVHMAFIGHPVAGDVLYNRHKLSAQRLLLHALRISIDHPKTKERLTFTAPVPASFFPMCVIE